MKPGRMTLASLLAVAGIFAIASGIAFALTMVTRELAGNVTARLKTPDGIEIYLDEGFTHVAESINFGSVEVDVFGTVRSAEAVPVWVKNQSNSYVRLTLDDDFADGDVVIIARHDILAPEEVLPAELTLQFQRGITGDFGFTMAFHAEGRWLSPRQPLPCGQL